jgi:WD40 repeat protein
MSPCPPAERFRQLVANELPAAEAEALESHIEACAPCQQALARLVDAPSFDARPGVASDHGTEPRPVDDAEDSAGAFLRQLAEHPPASIHLPSSPLTRDTLRSLPVGTDAGELVAAEFPVVAGFEILGELGRGGMGVVYQARQVALNRLVALKMILAGSHAGPEEQRRFRVEAEAIARLRHPNFVQVHDHGHSDGHAYLALEFVEGGTLARKAAGVPQPPAQAAQLVETLAAAMQHAHQLGLVHRDLKPANILFTADGVAKITDFGLAKRLEGATAATASGALLGTPSYMAPEQAAGHGKAVGPATDVYALGVILYELLTGRAPFQGDSVLEVLRRVQEDEPLSPARLRPGLPRDLETICLKCLRKDPRQRYASAADLADDLRRFLTDRPIRARRLQPWERLGRWCRRNPALAAVSGVAAAALVAVAVVSLSFGLYESAAAVRLGQALGEAETRRRQAEESAARFALHQGLTRCNQNEVGQGILWLAAALEMATRAEAVDLQHVIRVNLAAWRGRLHSLEERLPDAVIYTAAVSADATKVLMATEDHAGRVHLTAQVWEVATGTLVGPPLAHEAPISAVALSPDGKILLTAGTDHRARLWDAAGQPLGAPLVHPDAITAAAFSPDSRTVLTGSRDKTARRWQVATGQPLGAPLVHPDEVSAVAFSPDEKVVATGCRDSKVRLWDAASARLLGPPYAHAGRIRGLAFSPDGKTLLTGSDDATAQLWDVRTGQKLLPAPLRHAYNILAVAFSQDGRMVVTGSSDHTVRLWETATGRPVGSPLQHANAVQTVAFGPSAQAVLTGSLDCAARRWSIGREQLLLRELPHPREVVAVAFSPDAKTVLTGGWDTRARLWDVATGNLLPTLFQHQRSIYAVAFSPDGKRIVTGSRDQTAQVWDLATGDRCGPPLQHQGSVKAVCFSPDGRTVLTGSDDHTAMLWDAAAGRRLTAPLRHGWPVLAIAFGPEGTVVATGSKDHTARLWQTATGEGLGPYLPHHDFVTAVAFRPNGRTLVTTSHDFTARLWDVATGQALRTIVQLPALPQAAALNPGGTMLVIGCADRTARLCDVTTGIFLGPPLPHAGEVRAVAFSPDGRTLLTGGLGRTACLWAVPAPMQGDPARITLWAQVATGMELSGAGDFTVLPEFDWRRRRERLAEAGGAPANDGPPGR